MIMNMLVTSVSLPESYAKIWRKRHRRIMRHALHTFRVELKKATVKRGVTRRYNRTGIPPIIVTTRFTQNEYDALHFIAASLRISVSLLLCMIIRRWMMRPRQTDLPALHAKYHLELHKWRPGCWILTESLTSSHQRSDPDFTLHDVG
jgi:hypothetical protein